MLNLPFQKECTVFGALSVVLRMSKIFGLAPLKFKRVPDGWKIRVSPAASLYEKTTVCLICLITFVSLIVDFNVGYELSFNFKTNSDTVACIGTTTVVLLSLLAAAYSGTHRMQCVTTSMAQLQKVNIELTQHGPLMAPLKTPVLIISVCSFVGANLIVIAKYCLTLYYLMFEMHGVPAHILSLAFYVAVIMNKLLILQVTLLLAAVPASLHHLNECLKTSLQQIRNEHTIHKTPKMLAATVNHLGTLYSSICSVLEYIDDSYGRVLASIIPTFLISLVLTFYNLINSTFGGDKIFGVLIYIIFVSIHMTNMCLIIEPCHQTYEQMARTKHQIGQLLLFTPSEHHDVIQELEIFYKHLKRDVVYNPMRIFYLDRTVIVTVLGSIATYLVIMIDL